MPLSNIIRTPVQRIVRSIECRAESTANRVNSVTTRAFCCLEASLINKIEIFSKSHPRVIEALEPAICNVLSFSKNHELAFKLLLGIAGGVTLTASIILTSSFLAYFALPELLIRIVLSSVVSTHIAFMLLSLLLSQTVPEKLVTKYLERAVEMNKLTAAFFNLSLEFITVLNEWARNESQEIDSQWRDARKNIIAFYNSTSETILSLEHFNLHSIPNIFDHPNFRNKLTRLLLYDNHLTGLPESIGSLRSLTRLNLTDNRELTGLPAAILQLSPNCIVETTNCSFSAPVVERIRGITNALDYVGPLISHSMRNSWTQSNTEPSMEQSLRNFYRISGRSYNELSELKEIPNLTLWLHKLTWVADFKCGSQRTFVNKILEYLEKANEDSTFREVFASTIWDATESCGDRVALSVLNLGVAYRLSTIDLKNMHELYHLLIKGVLALDLLQDIARQKIPTLRMFDEIEVYLGYPVKLKEALDLPIDIESMLYFRSSALSPQDLENAKNSVLNSLSSEDMQVAFLKNQPKWIDALQLHYPEVMEEIAENPDTAEEALINLTKEIIQSFKS